jgi:serine/threonine protein kinase
VPVQGEIIAGRFRLVRELGRGSMGTVWLAYHLTLEVHCAVKFIVNEATNNPNYRARFHIEARTIAQLNSPNVVRVLDHDMDDDRPAYIAMEFLEGEDLETHLQRVGRLDAATTYIIVSQVARGLSRAHGAGIIHRDLKPANVFLARDGEERVVKLLDFGIAKWTLSSSLEESGGLFGTPEYMSPEQARGALDADCRSDLWSLAVIAYQCLTGQLPFSGETVPELLAYVTVGPIPVPSQIASDLSRDFDRWWACATSRIIDERFQTASALTEALGIALRVRGIAEGERAMPSGAVPTLGPEAASPSLGESCTTPPHRPQWAQKKGRVRFPASVAGAIALLVAMPAIAGHDGTPVARADLSLRDVTALESPPLVHVAPERLEVALPSSVPPRAADAAVNPAPRRVAAPEARAHRLSVAVSTLPRANDDSPRADVIAEPKGPSPKTGAVPPVESVPAPEGVIPKTDRTPKKEEALVDFGI